MKTLMSIVSICYVKSLYEYEMNKVGKTEFPWIPLKIISVYDLKILVPKSP